MAYDAKIIEVMIASPGDVTSERQVVRELLNEWNVMHARSRRALLVPIGWETHSAPELGGRPQQMINDRLLVHCDLLVGIFWTRLGSPTGVAASGTVEEIKEHVRAGKPAMLYFSSAPVVPDSLDQDQYAKLKEFKAWAKTQGLVAEYEGPEQFRERLRVDLELTLRDNAHLAAQLVPSSASGGSEGNRTQRITVSAEAAKMLKAAAKSEDGMIVLRRHMGGTDISAGRQRMLEAGAPAREVARWTAAIDDLERYGLIQAANYKREIFQVTHDGYEAASQIEG